MPSKAKYIALMEQVTALSTTMEQLRRDIRPLVETAVEKSLGDKINMINGALTESILQKEVLIDKGLITRAEINAKYKALKEK